MSPLSKLLNTRKSSLKRGQEYLSQGCREGSHMLSASPIECQSSHLIATESSGTSVRLGSGQWERSHCLVLSNIHMHNIHSSQKIELRQGHIG